MNNAKVKNSASKILLIALLLILAASLFGCGLFRTNAVIKDVGIAVESGLSVSEELDGFEASLGKDFVLSLSWTKGATTSPTITWFVSVDDGEAVEIENQTKRTLTYKFEEYSTSVYTFSAVANKVATSSKIKVLVRYAGLDNVKITSTTDTIVQGTIQQNRNEPKDIVFVAEWNDKYLSPDTKCFTKWFVDDNASESVEQEGLSEFAFLYTPSLKSGSETKISVNVFYGESAEQYKEASVKIEIVENFLMVDKVELSVVSGAVEKAKGIFALFVSSVDIGDIAVSANVAPKNSTNLNSDVVWTLRSLNGVEVLPSTERYIKFTPKYGKNVLTATIDNVVSKSIMIFAVVEQEYQNKKSLIENVFVWNGNIENAYLACQEDVNIFINYIVSMHKIAYGADSSNAYKMYLQPSIWKDGLKATEKFRTAIDYALNNLDESGKIHMSYNADSIFLSHETKFGIPTETFLTNFEVKQQSMVTHFTSNPLSRTSLPIDNVSESMVVFTSNQLFRALSWGYKPIFEENTIGQNLQAMYDTARNILFTIICNEMTEYQKVLAIYEWIVTNVDYDYGVVEDEDLSVDKLKFNAFYLEGVFNDMRAVCDGKSKAFSLLCGMEGIKSVRIVGKATSNPTIFEELTEEELNNLTGHAWNKVLIDANGDNVREWYVVDTTWGDLADTRYKNITEIMSMGYFLVTDSAIAKTHYSTKQQPNAITNFDYHKNMFISDGMSLEITTETQLLEVLKFAKRNSNIAFEIRNAISGVNSYPAFHKIVDKVKEQDLTFLSVEFQFIALDESQGIYIVYAINTF